MEYREFTTSRQLSGAGAARQKVSRRGRQRLWAHVGDAGGAQYWGDIRYIGRIEPVPSLEFRK